MVQQKRATAQQAVSVMLVWAAAACAPGKEPHPPPERKDAGSDIGEHCAALVGARVHSPDCDEYPEAPSRDAGTPNAGEDAAVDDSGAPGSDASPSDASPRDGGADARAPSGPDGGPSAPPNDCCTASPGPGCADSLVLACVCAGDAFCCSDEYDALCITQAESRCGIDCDERPPVSDCCAPSDVPSCSVPRVAQCVCEEDPFCCVFRFDENCVNLATARCAASCTPEVRQ